MITQFALKNNILTLTILLVLVISGASVFTSMPRDDMPSFLIRQMVVVTYFPGASPDRVENLVTDKIEKVIQEIPSIDYISSESRTGLSVVTISIKESESDLQPIFDKIRRKVDGMKHELPEGTKVKIDDEIGDVFGIIVGLTADGYSFSELKEMADTIRDGFIKLPNAAKVEISGTQDERIFVEFDSARLAELGLTKQKLTGIISGTNIIFPGGDIIIDNKHIILEPSGSFESVDNLKDVIISAQQGQMIRLGDVTKITRAYVEPRNRVTRINGQRGLAIAVNLKKGGNIIQLGKEVNEKIEEYLQIYPHGVELQRVSSQDLVVDLSVNNFVVNLVQATIIVLVVMLLLLGLRTGLVVASLIPVTMLMTLLIVSLLDIGLNKVSLASLIIALGMLVDNAIVMTESIMIKIENGIKAFDAAIASANELRIPLLVSSLTTSAAFMAFYLADSVMAEVMGQIFVVLTVALLSSWLLSMSMITLLCLYFIKVKPQKENSTSLFKSTTNYYKALLTKSLKAPYLLIGICVFLFGLSLYGMKHLPFIFMPKSDRAIVTVNLEYPLGTSIEKTESMIKQVEAFIKDELLVNEQREEGIVTWSSYVGEGAPKYDLGYRPPESSSNAAHILINTTSDPINGWVIEQLDTFVFENFPDITPRISRLLSVGGTTDPIAIRISGKDPDRLFKIVEDLKTKMSAIPGTKNISDDWGLRSKKILIKINTSKAQLIGITNQDIAISLQTVLSGAQIGTYREKEETIPIIMRNENFGHLNIEDLEGLNIYSQQSGRNVPLKQVAYIDVVWQSSKILRYDLYKTITVTSDLQPGYTAASVEKILDPWLEQEMKNWGIGYGYVLGGDSETSAKAMSAVIDKLPLSGFIILLLLISQFNSLRKPAIILFTIPLGVIGVVFGLLVTGSYFGFMAFLGSISLAGIVVNNAIVMLDRIKIEQDDMGRPPWDAIIEAAQQRFRPILLTTATTTLGLIPLWLGGGVLWEPMAISLIFGLLFATVLTLLFVPVLYRVLYKVKPVL